MGISPMSLSRYVRAKKVPTPKMLKVEDSSLHAWTEEEIETVRQLLPRIANGRKTRYKKLREEKQKGEDRSTPRPKKKKT